MKNSAPSSEFEDEDKCPSCGSPCDIHTDLDENDECNQCGNDWNIPIIPKESTKQELPKTEIDWSKFPKSTQKQVSEKYFRGLGEKDDEKSFIPDDNLQKKISYSEEEVLAFGKTCFYKGFDKAENDDANCYTAFREEIGSLFTQFKNK